MWVYAVNVLKKTFLLLCYTVEYPPRIWKRYVDDTFVIIKATKKEGFLKTSCSGWVGLVNLDWSLTEEMENSNFKSLLLCSDILLRGRLEE